MCMDSGEARAGPQDSPEPKRKKKTMNEILGDKWLLLSGNIKQEQFYMLKRAQELSSFFLALVFLGNI